MGLSRRILFAWLAGVLVASVVVAAPEQVAAQVEQPGSDARDPLEEDLPREPDLRGDERAEIPAGAFAEDGPNEYVRPGPPDGFVDERSDSDGKRGLTPGLFESSVSGAGRVEALAGPVEVTVRSGVPDGSRAVVEVVDEVFARQVSPLGAAAIVDFQNSSESRVGASAAFDVSLDLSDVAVVAGASAMERLRLGWYSGCELVGGEVRCDRVHVLDTEVDVANRTLSGTVDLADIRAAGDARVEDLVRRGVPRAEAEAPVLAEGHSLRDVLEAPRGEGSDRVVDRVGPEAPPANAAEAPSREAPVEADPSLTGTVSDLADEAVLPGPSESLERSLQAVSAASPSSVGGFGMLAAMSGSGGSSGDFAASPYALLQDFQVGQFTGAAETAYPIPVPAAAAGPAPDVRLGYSSAAVDRMNTASNNQAGPVGVGWSLSEPSITRSLTGGCEPGADGDLCFSEHYSIQLNGRSSPLEFMRNNTYTLTHMADGTKYSSPVTESVEEYRPVDASIQWRALRFTTRASQANKLSEPEWWLVITPDGTLWEFGRDETTVDYAPLYYDSVEYGSLPSGCDHSGYRLCTMGYQWHLEKVIDTYDNQIRYRRAQEFNHYRAQNAFYESYVRASRPLEITYTHNPSVTAQSAPNARVLFNWEWRCGATENFEPCDAANDWPDKFYDTPTDLVCREGNSSCPTSNSSPSFFSELRLGSIQTQIYQSADSHGGAWDARDWDTVATYDLRQAMPDPDSFSWFNGFTDPDDSEAKTALYSIHQRTGGTYEKYGYTTIEAEHYDDDAGISAWDTYAVDDEDVGGGFAAGIFHDGDWTRYEDVYLGDTSSDARDVWLRVRSANGREGDIQVRIGSATGTLLGTATVNTGGEWRTVQVPIANNTAYGVQDIVLVGDGTDPSIKVNWFRFQPGNGSLSHWDNIPSLDPTEFTDGSNLFEWLPNRVNSPAGVSPMVMPRIKKATNPLGGWTTFSYNQPSALRCGGTIWGSTGSVTTQNGSNGTIDNRTLCSPGYDSFTGSGGWVWWHKWVVTSATWDGPFYDNQGRVETYTYIDPRWGFPTDQAAHEDPSLCADLSWYDFRGFGQVTVTHRNDEATTLGYTRTNFFQGMHADPNNYGTSGNCQPTSTKSVTKTYGSTATTNDFFWRRGQVMQVRQLDSAGVELARSEYRMASHNKTQGQGATAGSIYERRYSYVQHQFDYLLDGTGTKTTQTTHTHDAYYGSAGRLKYVLDRATNYLGDSAADDNRQIWRTHTVDEPNWILTKLNKVNNIGSSGAANGVLFESTVWVYNAQGSVTNERTYYGTGTSDYNETDFLRDSQGRAYLTRNHANQAASTVTFDPIHGYLESVTNLLGHVTATEYDHLARPDKVTDPNLLVTEAAYDGFNRVMDVWLPGNASTSSPSTEYVYGESSGLKTIKTRSLFERTPSTAYVESVAYLDGFGRTVQTDVVSPANPTTHRTVTSTRYDGRGRASHVSAPYEYSGAIGSGQINLDWTTVVNAQRTAFDGLSRPTEIAQRSMGSSLWTTDFEYDLWTTTITDPNGHDTEQIVDAFGNLIEVIEHNGTAQYSTEYTYDRANRLTEVEDHLGNTTTIGYDLLGRKTSLGDPDSGSWSYQYDNDNNLILQTGPEATLWFKYDDLERVLEVRSNNSTGQLHKRYAYDTREKGYLYWMQSWDNGSFNATVSYDRNSWYQVIQEDRYIIDKDGNPQRAGIDFVYGDGGQLEQVKYPENLANYGTGEVVTYDYNDTTGLLETVDSDTTSFNVSNIDYDWAGRTTLTAFTTGWLHEDRWYEAATGRIAAIRASGGPNTGGWYQNLKWEFDNAGNVISAFDLRNPQDWNSRQSLCYEYDDLNRLTRAYTRQTTSGARDCSGTASMTAGGLTADAGTGYDRRYQYDAIGNLTQLREFYNDPTTSVDDRFIHDYTYGTGAHGPHAVSSVAEGSTTVYSYDYDDAGQMIDRNVGAGNQDITYNPLGQTSTLTDAGTVHRYRYDANGMRIRQQVGTTDTLYAGQWWEKTGSGVTKYYYVNGELTALSDSGVVQYVFKDHLDGVANTYGTAGHNKNRWHPFGTARDTLGITETDKGYTGQRADTTGLSYYNARYYDPTTARFTQPDALVPDAGNPQDLNRYSYVRNSPVSGGDPTGHCPEQPGSPPDWCLTAAPAPLETDGSTGPPPPPGGSDALTAGSAAAAGAEAARDALSPVPPRHSRTSYAPRHATPNPVLSRPSAVERLVRSADFNRLSKLATRFSVGADLVAAGTGPGTTADRAVAVVDAGLENAFIVGVGWTAGSSTTGGCLFVTGGTGSAGCVWLGGTVGTGAAVVADAVYEPLRDVVGGLFDWGAPDTPSDEEAPALWGHQDFEFN